MLRTIAALLLLSTPTLAEPPHAAATGDTIELRQCDPWPCIYYLNDGAENSTEVEIPYSVHGVEIIVTVEVTAAYEIIRVEPQDPAVIAAPPYAEVDDGADIEIDIILPLY